MPPTNRRSEIAACLAAVVLLAAPERPSAAQGAAAKIPLQAGLRVVTALSDREGDYESIKTIDAAGADGVTISYSADIPSGQRGIPPRQVSTKRVVTRKDLDTAHEYMQVFSPSAPRTIAGTTAIGVSAAVLTELKTKGQTTFTFQTPGREPSMDKVLAALTGKGGAAGGLDQIAKQLDASKASGTLTRVESSDVPFPVLVNGARTTVPAVHARGTFDDLHVEFYFLDDPGNPLALKWTTGTTAGTLQVVQITYAAAQAAAPIEDALEHAGRAEVHGIYFDFASATIKPESEPVLKEIAATLTKNPSWKLSVEGHTDNVGGDAANLDLSRRRAEAVKQALLTTYRVAAARLSTTGFGASKPKESNDTAEGRARNRRVELVRQ